MKVSVKVNGKTHTIEFSLRPGPSSGPHLVAIAKSSKDLDVVQDYIANQGTNDEVLGIVIAKAVEKQLKLPIEVDFAYPGAGFGLKFDLYSISKKLK